MKRLLLYLQTVSVLGLWFRYGTRFAFFFFEGNVCLEIKRWQYKEVVWALEAVLSVLLIT